MLSLDAGIVMKPFTAIEAAPEFVASFRGSAKELRLPMDDSLQDPIGLNMTVLVDHFLGREWEPAGYEQMSGYRIYRYTKGHDGRQNETEQVLATDARKPSRGASAALFAMRYFIYVSLLLMISVGAWACSCRAIASIDEAVAQYPILVEAQVVSLEEVHSPEYGRQVHSVTLRVKKALKGTVPTETIIIQHWWCYASLYPELMKVQHTYVLPLGKPENGRYSMAQCAHSGMELVDGKLYTFEDGNGVHRKLRLYKTYSDFQRGLRLESRDGR
jgi:hypothetical protein